MSTLLSEADSKRLIAAHGVPVVPDALAHTAAEAVAAATVFGFPVAVKLTGAGLAHKTERGLVRLSLGDAAAVMHAATELLDAARPADGAVELLVAPMLAGARELIAGVHADAQFGRCVMLGLGGVLAEARADVAFRLAPIEEVDAHEMLDELRVQALLGPVRGEPAVDRGAVAAVLLGLSQLAVARPDLEAIDVNPLVVVDGRPVAVDALVVIGDEAPA
jgi:succinyl-CoA synthetase beta subunit